MNVIAIMNHMGVYFKEEPIRELHRALERLDFRIVYPNDREDLLKLIENNARLCGVIFDWDKYNLELCEEISKLNEYMPLYAFANTYSTLDVSLNDLRMQVRFFEYALGAADDIADKIKQNTDEYIDTILPGDYTLPAYGFLWLQPVGDKPNIPSGPNAPQPGYLGSDKQ